MVQIAQEKIIGRKLVKTWATYRFASKAANKTTVAFVRQCDTKEEIQIVSIHFSTQTSGYPNPIIGNISTKGKPIL
jgi:hypothetical protein